MKVSIQRMIYGAERSVDWPDLATRRRIVDLRIWSGSPCRLIRTGHDGGFRDRRKTAAPNGSTVFIDVVKKLSRTRKTLNPSRGIIATGPAISRSFDLGGRFLPETPKEGSSLWARFFLARVRNGKSEMVSTATIVNPAGSALFLTQNR